MIARLITNYNDYLLVERMPSGLRKRRSLWRFKRMYPDVYQQYHERYTQEQENQKPEPEQRKRGRRKKVV